MTRRILPLLCVVFITMLSVAQTVDVTKKTGGLEQFTLSDIDNITFGLPGIGGNTNAVSAQAKLNIHSQTGIVQLLISDIDSVFFNDAGTFAYFRISQNLTEFALSDIDSITFDNSIDSTVYITYNGSSVTVENPLDSLGVQVNVSGANVTVNANSGISNIRYALSGSTSDGMFKIYSDLRLELYLNGVQITNPDGPAINVQTGKRITVHLAGGTTNVLTDGVNYATPPNNEDQDAAFFSEGQLIFEGSGNLTINGFGNDEHGLRSDDYIEVNDGNIIVNSAVKDGIHTNDGFFMNGGIVHVTSDGDGIDGSDGVIEITDGVVTVLNSTLGNIALKCDSTMHISGGTINITVDGDRALGLYSKQDVKITGGTLNINTTGDAVLSASGAGFDPSYCTAISAETNVQIDNCNITINTSGKAGRGISSDGSVHMNSGTLTITSTGDGEAYTNQLGNPDAYHGPCIKADANINLVGGVVTLSHSGDAGKGISVDGQLNIGNPVSVSSISITTTGNPITIVPGSSGEYAEAKAVSADNAIVIENANMTISSTDVGLESKISLTINLGVINITNSLEGMESPGININGGEIHINASEDGINPTFGFDGSQYDGSHLTINDGYVFVNTTNGDALDSNGDIFINGGIIIIHGPQSSSEVGVDVNGDFVVNGGFMVASGTNSDMTDGPVQSSSQYSVLLRTNQVISAGTLFHLEDASGNNLVTFAPTRQYYSIIFSSADLNTGTTYRVYTGGSSTGTLKDGVYTGGTYSGGTLRTSFTLSNIAQTVWF